MGEDFISRQIRRTNRNLLLMGAILLGIIGAMVTLTWRDVYNHLFGPFPTQPSELAAIPGPNSTQRYYLQVQGKESIPTGMQQFEGGSKQASAQVVALVVGDRLLLVKMPMGADQLSFKGQLAAIPAALQTQVVRSWEQEHPEAKGAFLPYMLDATGIWDRDSVIVTIAGLIFTFAALYMIVLSLRRMSQPDSHPLLSKLQRYGLVNDIRMQIDSEMRSENGGERFGPMHFTKGWVIHATAYKTDLMQVRDVIWAYPKVTKHYTNGIPTGKSYSAIIRDTKGQSLEVSGKKDSVPQLLQSLQRRMPWLLVGYSKELDALWLKEKPKFFALAEQRRAKLAPAAR